MFHRWKKVFFTYLVPVDIVVRIPIFTKNGWKSSTFHQVSKYGCRHCNLRDFILLQVNCSKSFLNRLLQHVFLLKQHISVDLVY